MQESLQKVPKGASETTAKKLTLFITEQQTVLGGVWSWDMQSSAVYCSDVMYFPERFTGTKGIIHPDDLPNVKAALKLLKEFEIRTLTFRIITTYGAIKTISGEDIHIESREPPSLVVRETWRQLMLQVISVKENEFYSLRHEINEETERLFQLGSWYANKDTGEVWYSDNAFRLHGMLPKSLNAHPHTFNHLLHPEDRVIVTDAFEIAFSQQAPLHIQYRIVQPDGVVKHLRQVTEWIFNQRGEQVFIGIIHDITAEQLLVEKSDAAEAGLKLHQQILRYSEQYMGCGYWYANLVTRRTSYSDNLYRIYGLRKDHPVESNSFLSLVHPSDRELVHNITNRMYSQHCLAESEFRIIRPDGKTRHLRQTCKIFTDGADQIMVGVVQDVTVVRSVEEKIQELNEIILLQKVTNDLAEATAEVSSIVWLANGLMQWSDGFYKLLGHRPGSVEAVPSLLYKYIYPEDLRTFQTAEATILAGHSDGDIHFRLVTRSGVRLLCISPRHVSDGIQPAVVGFIRDLTHQKMKDQQLAEANKLSSLIQSSISDMILLTNTEHTITCWTGSAEQLTGRKREDALHKNLFDVFPDLDDDSYLSGLNAALAGAHANETNRIKGYFQKAHKFCLTPYKNEDGEVIGVLHVIEDVSKELELQRRLSERLNIIESLVEASVDRVVVLDRNMDFLYWNKKAEEYYGINKQRVIGRNILEIFPALRSHPGYQQFRAVLSGQTIFIPASKSDMANENAETYLTPIKDENQDVCGVLWSVHDPTT